MFSAGYKLSASFKQQMLLHLKYNRFYATVHPKGVPPEPQDPPSDKEQGFLGERESDVKRTLRQKIINFN